MEECDWTKITFSKNHNADQTRYTRKKSSTQCNSFSDSFVMCHLGAVNRIMHLELCSFVHQNACVVYLRTFVKSVRNSRCTFFRSIINHRVNEQCGDAHSWLCFMHDSKIFCVRVPATCSPTA